jgi:AcrR family transcriptional regulator
MAVASTPTRHRIVEEAMRLFGEHGFRGTSVASIEEAAGLSPGAGGLYHHFESKDAVLAAGLQWHLERIGELRRHRQVLPPLGDARAEFVVMASFVLAELERERELFRVLATEARSRPKLLIDALDRLLQGGFTEFAVWLQAQSGGAMDLSQARALAEVGLGSLMWFGLQPTLFGVASPAVDKDAFVAAWTAMMLAAIGSAGLDRATQPPLERTT